MWKRTQHSFVGGMLDRDLMGRQDLEKYFKGASVLENFLVKRQGGISKRRGTALQASLKNLLGATVTYSPDTKVTAVPTYTLAQVQAKAAALGWAVEQVLLEGETQSGNYAIKQGDDTVGAFTSAADAAEVAASGVMADVGAYLDLDAPRVIDRNRRVQAAYSDGAWSYTSRTVTNRNAVVKARIVPLVYERDEGYYLLFSRGYAFVIGEDGILLNDGSFVRENVEFDCSSERGNVDAPFALATGYDDDEIDAVKFAQSGDMVFMFHKNHRVKEFAWDGAESTLVDTDFSTSLQNQPVIASVVAENVDGGGASKTIEYVVTAVVDGEESIPSTPYAVSYTLPWNSEGRVTITIADTLSDSNVEYYNVYLKESGTFGLIGSTSTSTYVVETPHPTVAGIDDFYMVGIYMLASDVSDSCVFLNNFTGFDSTSTNATPISRDRFKQSKDVSQWGDALCSPYGAAQILYTEGADVFATNTGENGSYVEFEYGDGGRIIDLVRFSGGIRGVVSGIDVAYKGVASPVDHYIVAACSEARHYEMLVTFADDTTKTVSKDVAYPDFGDSWVCNDGTATGRGKVWRYWLGKYISSQVYPNGVPDSVLNAALPANPVVELEINPKSTEFSAKKKVKKIRITGYASWTSETVNTPCSCTVGDSMGDGYHYYMGADSRPMIMSQIVLMQHGAKTLSFEDDHTVSPDLSLTPPVEDAHFKEDGTYPACGAFHQQRLCVASSRRDPFTFWMSCTGDIRNFSTHDSIREDDAIEATLSAVKFPRINHLIINKDLMALCDNGEWVISPVTGNALTYKTVSAKQQSALGCSKTIEPLSIGDEVLFANVNGEAVYATQYSFTTDGYESREISVLSARLFRSNPIRSLCYKQFPDSEVVAVLDDGTLATLVYMREHEVCAWSHAILGGGWKAVSCACNEAIEYGTSKVSLVVANDDGDFAVWSVRPDKPIDTLADAICLDATEHVLGSELSARWSTLPDGVEAYSLLTGEKVAAVSDVRPGVTYALGYRFGAKFVSVYPEPEGSNTIQMEVKSASNVEVRVTDGSPFTVKPYGAPDAYKASFDAPVTVDPDTGAVTLADRDVRQNLNAVNDRDGRIVIEHESPYPLTILSVAAEYQIEVAYAEGQQ